MAKKKKKYTQAELDANVAKFKTLRKRSSKDTKALADLKSWFKDCTNDKPGDLLASNGKDCVAIIEKSRDGYEVQPTSYLEVNLVDKTKAG